METPFLHPGFLMTVGCGVIGLIVWLIRLESKVNANDKELRRLDHNNEETWKEFDSHRSNGTIHFDQRLAQEVSARQGERMGRIENDVKEIKEMVKGLVAK